MATFSPDCHPRHHFRGRGFRRYHRLGLVVIARGGGEHEAAIANRIIEAVKKRSAVKDAVGTGRHHPRPFVRPALQRLDQPQPRQPEIRHGTRCSSDVLAELRLDQNDDRRRRLDPALGLVGTGTRHLILRARYSPHRHLQETTGNRRFRRPKRGAIGRAPEAFPSCPRNSQRFYPKWRRSKSQIPSSKWTATR